MFAVHGVEMTQSDLLDKTGKFISTRQLLLLIRRWRNKVAQIGNKNNAVHIEGAMKTASILKKVSDFVDLYCLPYYSARTKVNVPGLRNDYRSWPGCLSLDSVTPS